mmetsp:Transcript_6878/g.15973  ORF Transcript_6878/g.15973 Transcript_6878/m.15973 type:complete len:487 (-) Transcript_6878:1464-2924(-)
MEIVGVLLTISFRLEGRFHALIEQLVPILQRKERVLANATRPRRPPPQALWSFVLEHALDERLALAAHRWVLRLRVDHLLIHILDGVSPKRRQPHDHLIQDAAQRPPVHLEAVRLAQPNLRSKIHRSAAERVSSLTLLREAKIGQLDVPVAVEQHVLGLEVAVEDVLRVDVAHHLDHLHHRPSHLLGREPLLGEDKLREVAVGDDVHHEDEELGVLEGVLEVDEEGVLQDGHELLLRRDLLPPRRAEVLLHHLLLHHLHRVVDAAVALDRFDHLAEAALAHHTDDLEIVERRDDAFLGLELEDVTVVRRAEERLEARLAEVDEHRILRRLEDLPRLVRGDAARLERLDALGDAVDELGLDEGEQAHGGAAGDVLCREHARLAHQHLLLGQVLVVLRVDVEVESVERRDPLGVVRARRLLRRLLEVLSDDAAISGVAHDLLNGEAERQGDGDVGLFGVGEGLRELVEPIRLIGREEAEEARRQPWLC